MGAGLALGCVNWGSLGDILERHAYRDDTIQFGEECIPFGVCPEQLFQLKHYIRSCPPPSVPSSIPYFLSPAYAPARYFTSFFFFFFSLRPTPHPSSCHVEQVDSQIEMARWHPTIELGELSCHRGHCDMSL
jgi:hypothetical protein